MAKKFMVDVFATVNEDGMRQHREAFLEIPRKNGKTTLIAGCVVYQLFMSPEYGQEIYSAANDREQASLVFNMAASMIRANSALKKRCKIYDSTKRIVRAETESIYKALSRESATAHGLNPSFAIYDELHEAKNRDLYDVLKTGMGARDQPLMVSITTAGSDITSVCHQLYEYGKGILRGDVDDPTFYPMIFEADIDDDIWDERVWYKANPSLGAFRKIDEIRMFAAQAKVMPSQEFAFRRLYLNQWVQDASRWIKREAWTAAGGDLDVRSLLGRTCYAGLDLSSTDDFTALVLVFPLDDGRFAVLPFFWVPEAKVNKRRNNGIDIRPWARNGLVEVTPGEVIDYNYVLNAIQRLREDYDIREIAFDRWGAAKLRADIEAACTGGVELVQFGQGFRDMSPPAKELERMIVEKSIMHGNNPVLNWMADNVIVRVDPSGNIKPDKEKSADKIDGIVALLMGLDRAIRWRDSQCVYERRAPRFLSF